MNDVHQQAVDYDLTPPILWRNPAQIMAKPRPNYCEISPNRIMNDVHQQPADYGESQPKLTPFAYSRPFDRPRSCSPPDRRSLSAVRTDRPEYVTTRVLPALRSREGPPAACRPETLHSSDSRTDAQRSDGPSRR